METADLTLFDRVLVIDINEKTQLIRCIKRDNCTESTCKNIIKAQVSRNKRLSFANDVIDNNDYYSLFTGSALEKKIISLHQFYQTLCH